jgi:hypothetical protein
METLKFIPFMLSVSTHAHDFFNSLLSSDIFVRRPDAGLYYQIDKVHT